MKLSDLRACDCCGGKIAPQFYVLRSSLALFVPRAANATLGLAQMFGNTREALAIAEVMSPEPEVVKIAGDEMKELWLELFLCFDCAMKPVNLAEIAERRHNTIERQKAAT